METKSYPERIPIPNVCNSTASSLWSNAPWQSKQCPSVAVCVPRHDGDYCSCELTDNMFVEDSQGHCVPSTLSIVFGCAWFVMAVLFAVIFLRVVRGFMSSLRNGPARASFHNTLFVLVLCSLFSMVVCRIVRATRLVVHFNSDQETVWLSAQITTTALTALFTMITLLAFALPVRSLLLDSARLQVINIKRLRWVVPLVTATVGAIMFAGVIVTQTNKQYAASVGFVAVLTVFLVLMYCQVVSWLRSSFGGGYHWTSRSTSTQTHSTHSSQHSTVGMPPVLLHIEVFTKQILSILMIYILIAVADNVVWFVGYDLRSRAMLGPTRATLTVLAFLQILLGHHCLLNFLLSVNSVKTRSQLSVMRHADSSL